MTKLDGDTDAVRPRRPAGESYVEDLFRARYLEMVRLAGLLGADDPEDIAQEAFTRLMNKPPRTDDPLGALPYLRAIVVNLTRNRHRHLRVVRLRTPAAVDEEPSEQAAIAHEDHRDVLAAVAELPSRRREAIILRYWLDLPESEIAAAVGVSPGTVKSHVSRGLAALARTWVSGSPRRPTTRRVTSSSRTPSARPSSSRSTFRDAFGGPCQELWVGYNAAGQVVCQMPPG